MSVIALALALVLLLWSGVLLAFAAPLVARWREPVLRQPVLIIESDDWGAGPLAQADALDRLANLLQGVRDHAGRPAVMTLGVVLEVPDGEQIAASDCETYHALPLTDPRFDAVRAAMQAGIRAGVFVPQLHGQCHYWPESLIAAAQTDPAIRAWLTGPEPAETETLPSHLQTRWADAARLPSQSLTAEAIHRAVNTEAAGYRAVFDAAPKVAVATTFVWDDAVEDAWAHAGIDVVITPGHRATGRNAQGAPGYVDRQMLSGERTREGLSYLVRDVYFEPALGHAPDQLVAGLVARAQQGRACLVETHRFNFLREQEASLAALGRALDEALAHCPAVRFLSPLELSRAMATRDPAWIETRWMPRLRAWRARLDEIPRFGRIARLSGLAWPLSWLETRA